MKRFFTVLAAGLLILAITAPAMAWEFSMNGEYIHRMLYFGRTGQSDLFGVGNNVGFAGPNIYYNLTQPGFFGTVAAPANSAGGVVITPQGFSLWESDALMNDQRLTFIPTIRVNNAIRVHGVYNIGGYRNAFSQNAAGVGIPPFERYYMMRDSTYSYGTAGIGSWEQARLTVQLPIATMSIGIKDFPFGVGTSASYQTASDALLFVVPWGPLRILQAIYLARGTDGYANNPDSGFKNDYFGVLAMTYDQANLQIFLQYLYQNRHVDNGYTMSAAAPLGAGGFDRTIDIFGGGFKYNNGRFFLNAEYEFTNFAVFRTLIYPLGAAPGNYATQRYTEQLHFFTEGGFLCGPARLSAMWAWSPGNQRANQMDANLATPNPTKVRTFLPINYQVWEAYNYLMFYTYGGGNNVFDLDGHGNIGDANVYAARFDYAVASNLNVWGSYMWAERLEKDGYYAGQFFGGALVGGVPVGGLPGAAVPGGAFNAANGGDPNYPFAGNGFLGWEMNFGVDWKLLEGMSTFVRYAYWQPGDWFTRAYQYGIRDNGAVGAAPTRTIMKDGRDAINALYWSVVVNF